MKLRRHPANPVLLPDRTSDWETYNVLNPAVIHHNGLFHMYYRAQGVDWVSRIGYAVSEDGLHWNRLREPVLAPSADFDGRGVEDPRVTEIDGIFYMAFTAYATGSPHEHRTTPMIARSTNLISWEPIGPLVVGEDNKDHMLFPQKIDGRYTALHRRTPDIWLASSEDLLNWPEEHMRRVMGPRVDNSWDSAKIGGGGPPILTEHGWLALYHGYEDQHVYRIGVAMLDLEDPSHVISRPRQPILEPEEIWEIRGDVPNVVFSAANPVVDGTVYLYYGAADHVIGLATCPLDELIDYALDTTLS